jgi:hypothetical protein
LLSLEGNLIVFEDPDLSVSLSKVLEDGFVKKISGLECCGEKNIENFKNSFRST